MSDLTQVLWNPEEVKKIDGNLAVDDRGTVRFVNDFDFKDVKRMYCVENWDKNTIRAFHGHWREAKYVYVARGAIILAYAHMWNTGSIGMEEINKMVISSDKPSVVYIPAGYANGFKALKDDTIVMFFSTSTLEESKGDDIRFPADVPEQRGMDNFWEVENR